MPWAIHRRLLVASAVAAVMMASSRPCRALDAADGEAVVQAISAVYDAYRRPPGRDGQLDQQLTARIDAAKPAVTNELRRLGNHGAVRETALLLSAYLPLAEAESSEEFARAASSFTSRSNAVLALLDDLARRGSLADARTVAPAYNLLTAVRVMFLRRLGEIIPSLKNEANATNLMLRTLQANYDLVGAAAFVADGTGQAVSTTATGKLARHGEDEVVKLVRAAMTKMRELGAVQVRDRTLGPGSISGV